MVTFGISHSQNPKHLSKPHNHLRVEKQQCLACCDELKLEKIYIYRSVSPCKGFQKKYRSHFKNQWQPQLIKERKKYLLTSYCTKCFSSNSYIRVWSEVREERLKAICFHYQLLTPWVVLDNGCYNLCSLCSNARMRVLQVTQERNQTTNRVQIYHIA